MKFLLNVYKIGFMSYVVFFCCLFICKRSGSITSFGEERANLSAVVYL